MMNLVKGKKDKFGRYDLKGLEWRRNQFQDMIKRNWTDLSGEDVDNLVKKMRADGFYGECIPKGWKPKSVDAYCGCIEDIENYDYNQ